MLLLHRAVAIALGCALVIGRALAHSKQQGPLTYLSVVDNPEIQTASRRVHAHSAFDVEFLLHSKQQRVKLRLEPNHDIIPHGATVEYLDAEGKVARTELIERSQHKVFKGHAWMEDSTGTWSNVGWARIVVHRDGDHPLFEGAFTILHNHHHIRLRSSYMQTKHELDPHAEESDDEYMVVFRDSDIDREWNMHTELRRSERGPSCPSDQLSFNVQDTNPVRAEILKRNVGIWGSMPVGSLLSKRQFTGDILGGGNSAGVNLLNSIGQTDGCPSTRRVALVGVATDCTYTASFPSRERVSENVVQQMNSASVLYESTFNISLALRNLTISEANCPGSPQDGAPWNIGCSSNFTIQNRLNAFSQWRGHQDNVNSHWTLLTDCRTGEAVGLAWLGQACVAGVQSAQDSNGVDEFVSGTNVVARTSAEWQVIAHETGHTFGAVHDCTLESCGGDAVAAQQCCPLSADTCDAGERFLMNPSTQQGVKAFSPCSIGNICSALGRNSVKSDCLSANRGVSTYTRSQCGNGIVEEGEDCDCGGTESCQNNACCDAKTCKFKNNAVCDDSNEDCCKGCQFAPSTQVCRASTSECDPEEKCTGNTPICPKDETAPDGSKCGNGALTCASGHCTSRDLQCRTLMGAVLQNNDTYACDSSSCQLLCASPRLRSQVCYSMQQNFLDGTPCGGGGKCDNGRCLGSNPLNEIGSWISRNKGLVIGVGSALGGLLLISILCCIWGCFRRRKGRRQQHQRKVTSPPWPRRGLNHQQMADGRRARSAAAAGSSSQHWTGPFPPPVPAPAQPAVRYA